MDRIDPWWWNSVGEETTEAENKTTRNIATWATWATWHLRTTKLLDSNEGDMDSVVGWHSEDMRMLPMWNVSLQEPLGWMGRGGSPGVYEIFLWRGVSCWVSLKANPTDSESNDLPLLLSSRSSTRSFLIFGVCLWWYFWCSCLVFLSVFLVLLPQAFSRVFLVSFLVFVWLSLSSCFS